MNLEMNGRELRHLSAHLFAESAATSAAGDKNEDDVVRISAVEVSNEEVARVEDELVKTITAEADLKRSHKKILELAGKIDEANSKRKASLMQQVDIGHKFCISYIVQYLTKYQQH